jgi:hypothetical protein
VWISFSRHSPNWRVVQYFHSPSHKTTGQKYRKGKQVGGKNLARLATELVFLFANPEFYSHLVSWRVLIRTPVILNINLLHFTGAYFLSKAHASNHRSA